MSADAVVLAAESLAGLSWGDPETREAYARLLAPWDQAPVARQLAGEQSSCALAICAALLIAEVDGLVRGWRGRPVCDPLREPRNGHYDSIMYLQVLAQQRGLRRLVGSDRPTIAPGTWAHVAAPDHVLLVVRVEGDTLHTVEGGQVDPLNPRTPPKNCTAIRRRERRLQRIAGVWKIGDRRLVYTCDAGALPCTREGMPWQRIRAQNP